jgi:hypothetical protein
VADITIEVTSPGTLTTWGQSSWGSSSWGQISGLSSEQNSASVSIDISSDVIGEQLISTSNTVSINADAILTLDTNLLTTFVGYLTAGQSQEVEVTSPGDLPWGTESWGYGSWGNIGGMDISQGGEEVVVPSVEVNVIGNQLNTTIGTYSITADANLNLSTNLLTISLGDEDVIPNTIVNLSTNLLNIDLSGFKGASEIRLFDINGRQVINQKANLTTNQLNISKLYKGIYLVKVMDRNSNVMVTKKFIKE